MSEKKLSPVTNIYSHEYAEADSTTSSWFAAPSIEIIPISSDSLLSSQQENIYMKNVPREYEWMLIGI